MVCTIRESQKGKANTSIEYESKGADLPFRELRGDQEKAKSNKKSH